MEGVSRTRRTLEGVSRHQKLMASHHFDIEVMQRQRAKFTVTLYQDDGTAWGADAGDQLRLKVWRRDGAAADLDISAVANDNGSSITITTAGETGTTACVALADIGGDDIALLTAGARYKAAISFVDSSATGDDAGTDSLVADGHIRVKGSATGGSGVAS